MKKNILEFAPAIIAVLLAAGVMTIFRACAKTEEGNWMNCHNAQLYVFVVSIIIAVISIAAAFVKSSKLKICLGIVAIVLAIITALLPGVLVHLCMMTTMRCHSLMRPSVIILCLLFIVFELINGFFIFRKEKKHE